MKISEVIEIIEQYAPIEIADDGDRPKVGLQLGSRNPECTGVVTCLDATLDVIKMAVENGCNMVVSHHPLIYYPLQKVDADEVHGEVVAYALKNDVTVYSAHTNFDKCEIGTNASLVKMFGGKTIETNGCCFLCEIEPTTVRDFALKIASVLGDKSVKVAGNPDKLVKKFAVCSGGGGGAYSFLEYAEKMQMSMCLVICLITSILKRSTEILLASSFHTMQVKLWQKTCSNQSLKTK
ncbi:MAG: Nif3-like dinuclear metal center hexameric protein [Clostridia bacterium]|nr:Nif3-like dinuclear metal center hexameric protein [Clostridia bacterium]